MSGVPRHFDWVAYIAAADIPIYVGVHPWPGKIPRHPLSIVESSKLTGHWVVTESAYHIST